MRAEVFPHCRALNREILCKLSVNARKNVRMKTHSLETAASRSGDSPGATRAHGDRMPAHPALKSPYNHTYAALKSLPRDRPVSSVRQRAYRALSAREM